MNIITAKKVSQILSIHETTVRRLVKLSKIPHVWIGNSLRFDLDKIMEWLNGQNATSYVQVNHYSPASTVVGRRPTRRKKKHIPSKQIENTFQQTH